MVVSITPVTRKTRVRFADGEDAIYFWDLGNTVASESTLRSTGTLLSWVRVPPPARKPETTLLWTGYKNQTMLKVLWVQSCDDTSRNVCLGSGLLSRF
ncbi:hypothetical protein PoB_006079400 [Plakobranchus ocellatus]|uniref:Uncharacterized protein n=1 Tax=Plakobranchus ocellatus TaxID=259542 RepID=A0AAV4CR06_9GAST|nr:hypothetical protein PoB_006079400 [Plakobranchus ocellatus]